ncbi:MAG: hypothetical protein JWM68_2964 [Verrucomicrobiales bacterium]|nr:hypothetical protein [Verrucomicrobiales bacterium]
MAAMMTSGSMAKLRNKVQNALDESRILILGIQVLIGFQLRAIFEKPFEDFPQATQYLGVAALGILLVGLVLLLWPAAYHRIVERGNDTERLHHFTTVVMAIAVLPFAFGIGMDLFIAVSRLGFTLAVTMGAIMTACALFLWQGLEWIHRKTGKNRDAIMKNKTPPDENKPTDIDHKIRHVLTETRMVLPGAQALLGFQFITMLMEGFDALPAAAQYIHVGCLASTTLSIILLMTPAAYHRVVEEGEETEYFHKFASRTLLAAMIPLAWSVCGDFFVVLWKVTQNLTLSVSIGALMLVMFYGLWFGYTLYRRNQG